MGFSNSSIWNESLYVRYPINDIVNIGQLFFYNDNGVLTCQNYFDPPLDNSIEGIVDIINAGNKVMFKYINDSEKLRLLKQVAIDNNYIYETIDSWDAPRLSLESNLSDYLLKNCGGQIKKNYKKYKKNRESFKYYNSNNSDILKLWENVLIIDANSWKKEEKSDMKSLNREDLQYLPFLLIEKEKSNLIVVCDNDDNPLAYSLMFKDDDNYWYAVKWGASFLGRKRYAGFMALFNHLEYISSISYYIRIDFWGRRNSTYDLLKNNSTNRNHIIIYKKEE